MANENELSAEELEAKEREAKRAKPQNFFEALIASLMTLLGVGAPAAAQQQESDAAIAQPTLNAPEAPQPTAPSSLQSEVYVPGAATAPSERTMPQPVRFEGNYSDVPMPVAREYGINNLSDKGEAYLRYMSAQDAADADAARYGDKAIKTRAWMNYTNELGGESNRDPEIARRVGVQNAVEYQREQHKLAGAAKDMREEVPMPDTADFMQGKREAEFASISVPANSRWNAQSMMMRDGRTGQLGLNLPSKDGENIARLEITRVGMDQYDVTVMPTDLANGQASFRPVTFEMSRDQLQSASIITLARRGEVDIQFTGDNGKEDALALSVQSSGADIKKFAKGRDYALNVEVNGRTLDDDPREIRQAEGQAKSDQRRAQAEAREEARHDRRVAMAERKEGIAEEAQMARYLNAQNHLTEQAQKTKGALLEQRVEDIRHSGNLRRELQERKAHNRNADASGKRGHEDGGTRFAYGDADSRNKSPAATLANLRSGEHQVGGG